MNYTKVTASFALFMILAGGILHYSNIRAEKAQRASEAYEACIERQTGLKPWAYYQDRGYYPTCELSQGETNQ